MKIKYLKDAPLNKAGDIADVQDTQANVLMRLGIAELYTVPKKKTKTSKKTDTDDSE